MKKIYTLIIASACVLFAASCSNSSDEIVASGDVEVVESNLIFDAVGGDKGYVFVKSSTDITATTNESWCTITSIEGNTVHVSAALNPNVQGRTAMVTVFSGNSSTQIPAHQYGNTNSDVDTVMRTYNYEEQVDTLTVVKSSVPITVTTSETWATATVDADNNIILNLAENTGNPRTCVLTVVSGDRTYNVTIYQKGALEVSADTVIIGFSGGSKTVTVSSPNSYSASAADTWCTTSISGSTLTITAVPNSAVRQTTVTVTSGGVTENILVIQTADYADALGTWDFGTINDGVITAGTQSVIVTQLVAGTSYTVSGMSDSGSSLPFVMTYSNGKFYIETQYSGTWVIGGDTYYAWICPWDTSTGQLTWAPGVKLEGTWGGTATNPEITFADCGTWSGQTTDGILVYAFEAQAATSGGALGWILQINSPKLSR